MCYKIKYGSYKDSRAAILELWKKDIVKHLVRSFYWCNRCKGYHLTKMKANGKFRMI